MATNGPADLKCWSIETGELLPPPARQRRPGLTDNERRALTILSQRPTATVVMPRTPAGRLDITYATARALTDKGLAIYICAADGRNLAATTRGDFRDAGHVTITDTGRAAIGQAVAETPRLMVHGGMPDRRDWTGAETDRGYTPSPAKAMTNVLPDGRRAPEPEPVDARTQDRFSDEARERHKRTAREQHLHRRIESLTRAARQALRDGRAVGAEITTELDQLEALVTLIRAKADHAQAA